MDARGFRLYLRSLNLVEDEISSSIEVAERFDAFLVESGGPQDAESAWAFSRLLIDEGSNTEANYEALLRFCRFTANDAMYVAFLELVDGGEVGENLYRVVGERFGRAFQDEVFAGLGVAPYGTPSPAKPAYLQPVIERIRARLGEKECSDFLSVCLRDLPDDHYLLEREKLEDAGGIDAYLRQRKGAFLNRLEACEREGRLFFAQRITPEVLDLVRRDPEMGGGRREGSIIYETKVPYMTAQYLAETDSVMKRYLSCHCPWARDAIKSGGPPVAAAFCYCSAGFHKKPWEVIFGRPLRVDVMESALRGDLRCRFAIHLPAGESLADSP
jgi:hypothetical protein